eukprot:TRINITY_DN8784_c0_g1_i1.p2 TRINITY_DN8784_c0_g1~~TRINITY_DN8784_c0_g1_i1.p2  ORF type:complete len:185 (-),score=16.00 TRINITY_DN8784_c0_g1_i1:56-610(-)
MRKLEEIHWLVPETIKKESIRKLLASDFKVKVESEENSALKLYDDPDWDIWLAGAILIGKGGGKFEIHSPSKILVEEKVSARAKFWWEFPEGEVRDALAKLIKLRALQEKMAVDVSYTRFNVLNEDEKIVVRAVLTHHSLVEEADKQKNRNSYPNSYFITVKPLRGYGKEYHRLLRKGLRQRKV